MGRAWYQEWLALGGVAALVLAGLVLLALLSFGLAADAFADPVSVAGLPGPAWVVVTGLVMLVAGIARYQARRGR